MRKFGAIHRTPPPGRLIAGGALLANFAPSPQVNYTEGLTFDGSDMLGNDSLSNCVEVAFMQLARLRWKIISGDDYAPTAAMVSALYSAWTGYRPDNPQTDLGTDVLDALDHWATRGIWIKPGQLLDIGQWFSARPKDVTQIMAAVDYGVGALLTVNLLEGDDHSDFWEYIQVETIIGVHEVVCVGYDSAQAQLLTWGKIVSCKWPGLIQRCLSVSVPLSRLLTDALGKTATGQTWAQVNATMQQVLGAVG